MDLWPTILFIVLKTFEVGGTRTIGPNKTLSLQKRCSHRKSFKVDKEVRKKVVNCKWKMLTAVL